MKDVNRHGKSIDLEELKVLQMNVLQAVDEYCNEHNIRYSMACGTLLGAIRHQGYIPWDDDIDIYVPREDYKRLIAEFPETYKGRYKIASLERSFNWTHPFANAYDDKTIFDENSRNRELIGVKIDIFPVDEVPLGEEWIKYNQKRRRLQRLFSLYLVRLNSHRSLLKNAILLLVRILSIFFPTRKFAEYLDRFAQQNNYKGYEHMFECCLGMMQKQPFPKSLFDSLVYVPFEDRHFKAFSDSDYYLSNGFGNYMQLPPKEKRVSHHAFKAYWK